LAPASAYWHLLAQLPMKNLQIPLQILLILRTAIIFIIFQLRTASMPSYDNATRAQALTMKLLGHSNADIESITGIQPRTVNTLLHKAISRGLNPEESKKILDYHIEDDKRSGRPIKQTKETATEILSKVCGDHYAREKTCTQIAADLGNKVSDITVWRVLRAAGFRK